MLLYIQLDTFGELTMNPPRIRDTTLYLAHLEKLRYKERTHQQTTHMLARQMLARLRAGQLASIETASVARGPTYHPFIDETGVSTISPTADAMEMDTDAHTSVVCRTVTPSRKFVKPGSVQYRAFDVDQEMDTIMKRVVTTYPEGCSESLYQKAVLREAYLSGLPVMVERDVFADYGSGSLLMGRVDMEVAGVCLYELKIGTPKIMEHSKQLGKYLRAYDHNKENIQVAKLVYFTPGRVVTHVMRDATPAFS
jgi:PD-(D/E)XK nuclease superfamily